MSKRTKILTATAVGVVLSAFSVGALAASSGTVISKMAQKSYEEAAVTMDTACGLAILNMSFIEHKVNTDHGGDISEYTDDAGLVASATANSYVGETLQTYTSSYITGNTAIEYQFQFPTNSAGNELLNDVKVLCSASAAPDAKAGIGDWTCSSDVNVNVLNKTGKDCSILTYDADTAFGSND